MVDACFWTIAFLLCECVCVLFFYPIGYDSHTASENKSIVMTDENMVASGPATKQLAMNKSNLDLFHRPFDLIEAMSESTQRPQHIPTEKISLLTIKNWSMPSMAHSDQTCLNTPNPFHYWLFILFCFLFILTFFFKWIMMIWNDEEN